MKWLLKLFGLYEDSTPKKLTRKEQSRINNALIKGRQNGSFHVEYPDNNWYYKWDWLVKEYN